MHLFIQQKFIEYIKKDWGQQQTIKYLPQM